MIDKIAYFIKEMYGNKSFIPLHEPCFLGNEKKYLIDCVDSTFVSSVGAYVDRFERELAQFVGSKYAVATSNGTSALHAALIVGGVKFNDEVITQALSFVATSNAISYIGAHPIFLDVEQNTLGLSPSAVEAFLNENAQLKDGMCINKQTGRVIRACVPMHTFGIPCNIRELKRICDQWSLVLVEDAAESLGSYAYGQHTGTFGLLGIFSFNGNKIVTSGGGGVIVTDDEALAKKVKHITTTAKMPHQWEYVHDMLGYNYRMPNLNAALLCAQLEQINLFIKSKRQIAQKYINFFAANDSVRFVTEPAYTKANYWLNAVVLQDKIQRDYFLRHTNEQGVSTRPIWQLLSDATMYRHCQRDNLVVSRWLSDRVVNIPSSVQKVLSDE